MLTKRTLKLAPLLLLTLAFLLHQPLLTGLGNWLAPVGAKEGEAVVVEGTQVALSGGVKPALDLLQAGKVQRLYLVLHRFSGDQELFAIQEAYAGLLGKELEKLGLSRDQYRVLPAPVNGHPIALAEARHVVPVLAGDGVKKVILMTAGFHTRRSWRVYQRLGHERGIRFEPRPYFPSYSREEWWKKPEGWKDFVGEGGNWFTIG